MICDCYSAVTASRWFFICKYKLFNEVYTNLMDDWYFDEIKEVKMNPYSHQRTRLSRMDVYRSFKAS